jgi:hypothetical protein
MQDHSHRLFFLGVTGLMCAAALYGAQVVPDLFAGAEAKEAFMPATFDGQHQGLVSAAFGGPPVLDICGMAPLSPDQAERAGGKRSCEAGARWRMPAGGCVRGAKERPLHRNGRASAFVNALLAIDWQRSQLRTGG